MSVGWRLAVLLLVLCVAAVYTATSLRIRTDVVAFLPAGADAAFASVSRHLSDSELARSAVLTVGAGELPRALAAAGRIADGLRELPEVAWVRDGPGPRLAETLHALYFPRRHAFLTDAPGGPSLSDADLAERARRLERVLRGPRAPLVAPIAAADPLLAFPEIVERIRGDGRDLSLRDGRFVTGPPEHAVVLFGTRASAFDAGAQRRVQRALAGLVSAARRDLGEDVVVEQSGVGRFTARVQAGIARDVRRVGVAGALGVALLFLFFFRSPAALAIVVLPTLAGALIAAASGLLVFGALNGLSVAFGMALAGVSVDYTIHLLNHTAMAPSGAAGAVARRLRPSLLLGGATTVASLAGVAVSNFPGFHQMGLLALIGVGASLLLSLAIVPTLGARTRRAPVSPVLAARLERFMSAVAARRAMLAGVAAAGTLVGLAALPRVAWVDDLRELTTLDPALLAEEERVRSRVARFDANRFAIVLADDWESALVADGRLHGALEREVEAGTLGAFRSLHTFLWSERRQRANERALRRDPDLPERLDAIYAAEGFRPGAFEPFAEDLRAEPPEPLTLADLRGSELADLVRPLAADLGERRAVLTYFVDVRDEGALRAAVESVAGARYFDQRRFVREVYGEYRERTLVVVATGCVAILALLWLRYRRLRETVAVFLPPLVVALLLAAIAAALGVRANLLHVVGLVLVMGAGVDYGIFLVDSRGRHTGRQVSTSVDCGIFPVDGRGPERDPAASAEVGVTALSLLLSGGTTVLVFGVLALSEHPVLRALGATASVGVALSFALAPLSLMLAGPRAD